MAVPTAILVIVGDEILAGHTLDTNSHYLANRLRARGLRVLRKETLPDDPKEIDATLQRILARDAPSYCFVVGGIGPTPDDRTYEGVARALNADLVVTPEARAWMEARARKHGYGADLLGDPGREEPLVRMIRLPRGATPLWNPVGAALGCVAERGATRVVVLPGVPRELTAMVEASFEPRFLPSPQSPEAVQDLEVWGQEIHLWDVLRQLEAEFPQVRFGSYPQSEHGRIVLRLAGPSESVARAAQRLRERTKHMSRPL